MDADGGQDTATATAQVPDCLPQLSDVAITSTINKGCPALSPVRSSRLARRIRYN